MFKFKILTLSLLLCTSTTTLASIVSTDDLLSNGDFKNGLSNWLVDYGNVTITKNSFGSFTFASSTSHYAVSQYIDISSFNDQLINSGEVSFSTSYWQDSHIGKDKGKVLLAFFDENGERIGYSESLEQSPSRWEEMSLSGYIPEGTKSIRYRFIATRYDGGNLDAYFTGANVVLSTSQENINTYGGFYASDVPVSFTAGLSLLGLAAGRRKYISLNRKI